MNRNDNGCRFGDGLGDIRIHAHFGGTSIKVVNLLKLAVAHSSNSREGQSSPKKLHPVQVLVCDLFGKRFGFDGEPRSLSQAAVEQRSESHINQFRSSAPHSCPKVACTVGLPFSRTYVAT